MTVKLHTHDIQQLMVYIINAGPFVANRDENLRLIDILCEINRMCNEENGYTVTVTDK